MGGGNYNMNSSQFEFFRDESYNKKGGCFVTTPKAIIYVVIALISLVLVALVMYYYGPYSSVVKTVEKPMDIEKLLNYSVGNISQDIRLPKHVMPTLYNLKLDPIVEHGNSTLQGEVTIRIKCLRKTRKIILNAEKLNILSVQVFRIDSMRNRTRRSSFEDSGTTGITDSGEIETTSTSEDNSGPIDNNLVTTMGTTSSETATTEMPMPVTSTIEITTAGIQETANDKMITEEIITSNLNITEHYFDAPNSKYIIKMKKDLDFTRQYVLNIRFSSNISDSFQGLYQSTYEDNRSILATQLQPIYARKVFPCFDEPSFKSPIQLTIRKHINISVLSNTLPSKSYRDNKQRVWDEFQTTPSIPTYLMGFIIGDLVKMLEERYKPLIRIWGIKDSNIEAVDAIDFTKRILGGLEKYFAFPYPLQKIDIVAVRGLRFTTASAGLIFIREELFLTLPKLDVERKNELFAELTKALTKEWIGNLVSVNWWNDFWLINGFSIFMLEEMHSGLGNWDSDFTLRVTQQTLHSDDLKSALSLTSEVENSIQIIDISDMIKYNKGSCILRMLNVSLAPLTFRKGFQSFVKEWQGNFTDVEHLWKSLDLVVTEVDNLPNERNVTEIMKTWTTQPAYPLVTVTKNTAINGLNVNQTKFNFDVNNTDSSFWIIPIRYMIGTDDNIQIKQFWLTEKAAQIKDVTKDIKDMWILFNVGQTGYYRVNYGLENWRLLMNILYTNYSKIPVENRGELINDAFDLAEHGLLDYNIPFNLSKYLIHETHYIPWASALKSLEFIRSILETTYLNGAYEDYIMNLIGNIYDKISIEDDPDVNKAKLKDLIIESACSVNYINCTKWAQGKLQEWIEDPNIKINNRKIALCTGIRLSGRREWEIMFERLRSGKINAGVEDLYMALGCSKQLWLINRYLDSTLNDTIPLQYVSYVWQSIHQIPSRTFGFKFLRENWEKIYAIYNEKRLILKTIIQDFLYALSTKSDKEDLTLFFRKYAGDLQGFSYLLKSVVDRIDTRICWAEKHLKTIDTWLSSHEY